MAEGIKIKVESGEQKIEITIGSDISPEHLKVLQKVLQTIAESGTQKTLNNKSKGRKRTKKGEKSVFFKTRMLVLERLANGQWFTSLDLRELYEEVYGEQLPPNAASTYLRRLEETGLLESRKIGKIVEYRLIEGLTPKLKT